jgi:hypothetical protein
MLIHQKFKDELKTLNEEIKNKMEITDIDSMPNEDIIKLIYKIYTDE